MRSLITNASLLCWGMVFSVKLLIAATSAHDLSSAELAQTAKFPSQIQQRFSLSSDDASGDRFASRRIRAQSALRQPKIYGGTKSTGDTKNSPGLPLLSSSSSSSSSSFLSSFTSSLSSSFASAGLSPTSLSSSLAAAAAASSLSSSSSSAAASSSLFSSSSKSILFGRPGDNADSVTTALEYMEGTLTASQMAKCENLPLLGQFKGELDRQSFNTFISEGSGPVWLANILSRLSLVNGPSSTSSAGDSGGRKSFHSVLLRSLLSQSRTLAGAAIVVSEGDPATPNNTQHLYVYPKEDHYVTLDTVSEQRRKVYGEMLQKQLNSNNQSARSNRSPDEAYKKKMSDTLPPRRDRIKFKAVNFKAGSWSNIYFDCNLSKSWLLSYAAPYLDSRGAYRSKGNSIQGQKGTASKVKREQDPRSKGNRIQGQKGTASKVKREQDPRSKGNRIQGQKGTGSKVKREQDSRSKGNRIQGQKGTASKVKREQDPRSKGNRIQGQKGTASKVKREQDPRSKGNRIQGQKETASKVKREQDPRSKGNSIQGQKGTASKVKREQDSYHGASFLKSFSNISGNAVCVFPISEQIPTKPSLV